MRCILGITTIPRLLTYFAFYVHGFIDFMGNDMYNYLLIRYNIDPVPYFKITLGRFAGIQ